MGFALYIQYLNSLQKPLLIIIIIILTIFVIYINKLYNKDLNNIKEQIEEFIPRMEEKIDEIENKLIAMEKTLEHISSCIQMILNRCMYIHDKVNKNDKDEN